MAKNATSAFMVSLLRLLAALLLSPTAVLAAEPAPYRPLRYAHVTRQTDGYTCRALLCVAA